MPSASGLMVIYEEENDISFRIERFLLRAPTHTKPDLHIVSDGRNDDMFWWSVRESNPQPCANKAPALPIELTDHF